MKRNGVTALVSKPKEFVHTKRFEKLENCKLQPDEFDTFNDDARRQISGETCNK